MNLISPKLSSISAQAMVKYLSLSLIGVSAVAGLVYEEISEGKLSSLLSHLGSLIPGNDIGGGGKKLVKVLMTLLME